ncbi:MAG: M48 family metalloprotease, partial [Pseudomonadota bacterium]
TTADDRARQLSNTELGKFFGDVVSAQHSQKHERQADDYAFEFMQDKGYDANACVTALEKLVAMSGPSDGFPWTKTHPSPKSRAKRMRKKLG